MFDILSSIEYKGLRNKSEALFFTHFTWVIVQSTGSLIVMVVM
jgi:hypothetical protein